MTDYRFETKVKNNRIYSNIVRLGFNSISSFCAEFDLHPAQVGKLINIKESPITEKGGWRKLPLRLAEIFSVEPEDLFTEKQMMGLENGNIFIKEMNEADMILMFDNKKSDPVLLIEEKELSERVDDALGVLSDIERDVLEMRNGFNGHEMTLVEIGKVFNVTRERIRLIEERALRKLRHPKTVKYLKEWRKK